jgi:AraC-like DNA-binding protein
MNMDALSSILEVTKLKGVVCDKLFVSGPWGLEVVQNDTAQFWRLIKGSCIVGLFDGTSVNMEEGDIVVVPHGAAHWVGDQESSPRVLPAALANAYHSGTPLFNGPGKETLLVGGHFSFDRQQTHPFLKALPPMIRITQFGTQFEQLLGHAAGLMLSELNGENPGSNMMRRGLAEILFVTVIRAYLEQSPPENGFLAALNDPQISDALKLMHEFPATEWTLESLAKSVAMSRSVFAGRFKKLVGETPLTYLTNWRINRACDMLKTETISIDEVASKVGYQSLPAFNRIFKTITGETPAAYRRKYNVSVVHLRRHT